jgi:hypothetical protein
VLFASTGPAASSRRFMAARPSTPDAPSPVVGRCDAPRPPGARDDHHRRAAREPAGPTGRMGRSALAVPSDAPARLRATPSNASRARDSGFRSARHGLRRPGPCSAPAPAHFAAPIAAAGCLSAPPNHWRLSVCLQAETPGWAFSVSNDAAACFPLLSAPPASYGFPCF